MLRRKLSQNPSALEGTGTFVRKDDDRTEDLDANKKRRRDQKIDPVREAQLEEEVLGTAEDILETLPAEVEKKKKGQIEDETPKQWEDSDDEADEDSEYMRTNPAWANKYDDDKSDDSDDEVLRAHSHNVLASSVTLPTSTLDYKRVTDANKEDPSAAALRSVEFHRNATVLLTGGQDNTIRLFAIDGNKNTKIHSMFMQRTPILCCHFNQEGTEIVIGSKFKSFYIYDMEGSRGVNLRPKIKGLQIEAFSSFEMSPDGKFIAVLGKEGYVHLFSQRSKELIDSLKMNGEVKSICFSKDGGTLYTFGSDGEVYVWNLTTRSCIHHFSDHGCINGTCVSVSPDDRHIVCGSSSGIVNVYERESVMASRHPEPIKLIKNLTTSCTESLFSPQSEMLALRTRKTDRGIKLVHFPSISVFQNFPDQFDSHLGRVTCMDFSPSSGYFALGNYKGRCLLYRLQHYKKY